MQSESGGYQTFQGPFFSLRLPSHWEIEVIENMPAFFDPEGNGVLQVAALKRQGQDYDIQAELERYLAQNQIEADPERMSRFRLPSGLNGIAVEYIVDNRFWMVNALGAGNQCLLAIYNSDEVPDQGMAMLISEALASIEFMHS